MLPPDGDRGSRTLFPCFSPMLPGRHILSSFRGATWVSIHNGGGVGWGEVINGGFGILIMSNLFCCQILLEMRHWVDRLLLIMEM